MFLNYVLYHVLGSVGIFVQILLFKMSMSRDMLLNMVWI